jgi:hypothetical protein
MTETIPTLNCNYVCDEKFTTVLDKAYAESNNMIDNWCKNYDEKCSGGKMRGDRGDHIENLVKKTVKHIQDTYGMNVYAVKGSDDKKQLSINYNEKIIKKDHQVDMHIYKDDKFIAAIECKAYLDSCFYVRACDDFTLFKKYGYDIKTFVFTLEDSIDENSKLFIDIHNNFICDEIFCMLDGKRSSSKPIYNKKYKKHVNKEKLTHFITALLKLFEI